MERIIAGRFHSKGDADAVSALIAQYVDADDICIFQNNPPGQHDAFVGGGDEYMDPDATGAGKASAWTALAGGLAGGAIGAAGGPVVAIAAAATGAMAGAMGGAMAGLGDKNGAPHITERRVGGVMLSVRIAAPMNQERVIASLRAGGAADIEEASGEWLDGDWTDFDPVAAPRLV